LNCANENERKKPVKQVYFVAMSLALATGIALVQAQQPPASMAASQAEMGPQTPFAALAGRWVRPDGGYVINIKAVDASGKLDASYANPSPLPFYTAVVTSDGGVLKLFLELRAGGYNGSTYALSYDAASDRLTGVYYQAVAKQKFEAIFVRAKS
jgi:hypothetical protein